MKKFDIDFEGEDGDLIGSEVPSGENFPTAVYTVYNVHGEPIGHKFYSYQPVYEPEDDELVHRVDSSEYEDSGDIESDSHITILKGGTFPDHDVESDNDISENINKLKHQYFERYVDRRRKRFLSSKTTEVTKKDVDIELRATDSNIQITTQVAETKPRHKRHINLEEFDRQITTTNIVPQENKNVDLNADFLKVIPLSTKAQNSTTREIFEKEMAVIPLQYNNTNSTEIGNRTDKREKRTSRKTDRLNQTTATVPKT